MRLVQLGVPQRVEYVIGKRVLTIGSAQDNNIVLQYNAISRYHATIRRRLGRCILTDLNSTNGVIVNGERINGSVRLRPGDEIRFASVRFSVKRDRAFYIATVIGSLFAIFAVAFAAELLVARGPDRGASAVASTPTAAATASVGSASEIPPRSASGFATPEKSPFPLSAPGSESPSAASSTSAESAPFAGKLIYVTNGNNTVTEYAFGTTGETSTPHGIIVGDQTGLSGPTGIAFDSAGNIYVANNGNGTITEYSKGSTGNVIPIAIISGPSTGLSPPTGGSLGLAGIAVRADKIYVAIGNFGAEGDGHIEIFPVGANGNVAPQKTIQPPTRNGCVCSFGGFAAAEDSTIFIAVGDCIFRYSSPSREPMQFSLPDPENVVPVCPYGLSVDPSGNLFTLRNGDDALLKYQEAGPNRFVLRGVVARGSARVFAVDRDGYVYNISGSPISRVDNSWVLMVHSPGTGAADAPIAQIYGPASGLNQPTALGAWP